MVRQEAMVEDGALSLPTFSEWGFRVQNVGIGVNAPFDWLELACIMLHLCWESFAGILSWFFVAFQMAPSCSEWPV